MTRPHVCCHTRGARRCRYFAALNWWAAVEMTWDDYLWLNYGQYGARP